MYITYGDYQNLGYSSVPREEFKRYSNMAEKTARRFAAGHKVAYVSCDNKRGLCEIADLYYAERNQLNRPVSGFSNENYREQYFQGDQVSFARQVWELLCMYFTPEQLYRGV
ncbi:MAG: hypothetical protein FWD71_03255 [Oscillospiraceae bacterium]|nr:hypothetical protein [Oscillospiraceae bacterium]